MRKASLCAPRLRLSRRQQLEAGLHIRDQPRRPVRIARAVSRMRIKGLDDRPPGDVVLGHGNDPALTKVEQEHEVVSHKARVAIGNGPRSRSA